MGANEVSEILHFGSINEGCETAQRETQKDLEPQTEDGRVERNLGTMALSDSHRGWLKQKARSN
jgi:hypothetical protein